MSSLSPPSHPLSIELTHSVCLSALTAVVRARPIKKGSGGRDQGAYCVARALGVVYAIGRRTTYYYGLGVGGGAGGVKCTALLYIIITIF